MDTDPKGHNVEFIAGPEGFEKPKKSKLNKEYHLHLKYGMYLIVHPQKVWV